jgi:hypothetical protein
MVGTVRRFSLTLCMAAGLALCALLAASERAAADTTWLCRPGADALRGGPGEDEIVGVNCGTGGSDIAKVDRRDRVRRCETVRGPD